LHADGQGGPSAELKRSGYYRYGLDYTSADVKRSFKRTKRKRHTKHYNENKERGCARADSEGTRNEGKNTQ